jgi:hypothetical protein
MNYYASLIFASEAGAYPRGELSIERLLALLTHARLAWKNLSRTNTLAYFVAQSHDEEHFYDNWGLNVIRRP